MKRGEIWLAQFDPVVGHEQGGPRPAIIVSSDAWNGPPGNLVTVLPITSKPRKLPSRVRVMPPEGGLTRESWIICEQVRTVSTLRLRSKLGSVAPATMRKVSTAVRMLLDLD